MDRLNIRNCRFCGRLFNSAGPNVCPACSAQLDEDFVKIRDYRYGEPEDTGIQDLAEKTGVSEKAILYLLSEGRLSAKKLGAGGSIKCAICGAPIASGRLCRKCLGMWNKEMHTGGASPGGAPDGDPFSKNEKMHTSHK